MYSANELKKLDNEEAKVMESVIAKNVKEIIKERGLKQSAVGKKAGYDYRVFSNMLNGRKIVTDVDVAKIANALEV